MRTLVEWYEDDRDLSIWKPYSNKAIEAKRYKSVAMGSVDEYSIEVLRQHGGYVRKLFLFSRVGEISTSSLVELFSVLPSLEEIRITYESYKFDARTSTLDLSRIKSLHCCSEECFAFFSSLMPDNCLEKLIFTLTDIDSNENFERSFARFENFIQRQPSIRSFYTEINFPLNALNLLTLDELKFNQDEIDMRELTNILKSQPNLKVFECGNELDLIAFEELCNHSKLESILINVVKIEDGKNLEKLKNLKQLGFRCLMEVNQQRFFTFELDSLERLIFEEWAPSLINIPEILENISNNLPNLKMLKLNSTQNVNFIAKMFQSLEQLELNWCELWEYQYDTEIVHHNLKKLKLVINKDFCSIGEVFFELFKIFPNLEHLNLKAEKNCEITSKNHTHLAEGNFIAKLINLEKLKSIQLPKLKFNLNNLSKIVHQLKMMTQKFDNINITFEHCFKNEEPNSSFESVLNELKKDFLIWNFTYNPPYNEFKSIRLFK